jgi:hypothetical protein
VLRKIKFIREMGGKFSMNGGDKSFQNLVGNPVEKRDFGDVGVDERTEPIGIKE